MMSSMPKVQHTWICRNYMIDLKSTCLKVLLYWMPDVAAAGIVSILLKKAIL